MSNVELLIEEIKTLPENYTAVVIEFVGYLKEKAAKKSADQGADDSWFERGEECPICAKHRDPVTGELRFNAEVMADIQEADDMLSGKIPSTLRRFDSFEEMWEDLMRDDPNPEKRTVTFHHTGSHSDLF